MKKNHGYATVYLSLTMGILLSLLFTLIEGVRIQTTRMETESVTDVALFSTFAEYNRALLEQYDLFFIDSSYGKGQPELEKVKQRLLHYMNKNFHKGGVVAGVDLTGLSADNVDFPEYRIASDQSGDVVKSQAIEYYKDKTGLSYIDGILPNISMIQNQEASSADLMDQWDSISEQINELIEEKRRELLEQASQSGEEIDTDLSLDNPADQVRAIKEMGIMSIALPEGSSLSSASIQADRYLSHRQPTLVGNKGLQEPVDGITDTLIFEKYLMEKCGNYQEKKENKVLSYQIEYILFGENEDTQNLENTLKRILAIREAANMMYLFSDSGKQAEADLTATVITVALGIPGLQELVKLSLLFAWGYAESVKDIRILLDGGRVPIGKSDSTWNTPFLQLINFPAFLGQYHASSDGMNYQDYLETFLFLEGNRDRNYRFMDLCEMDVQKTAGNENFRMDGCIDYLKASCNVSSSLGYGYEITREYQYCEN